MEEFVDHEVQDLSAHKGFFTIPNIVLQWPGLRHAPFRLYCWYKMVCGEKPEGRCWTSLKTIADGCSMSIHTVIDSREKLKELGLIEIERQRKEDGSEKIIIKIIDVWEQNKDHKPFQKGTAKQAMAVQTRSAKQASGVLQNKQAGTAKLAYEQYYKNNTTRNNTLSVRRNGGADEMSFFSDNGEDQEKTSQGYQFAKQLYQAVVKNGKYAPKNNLRKWAKDFTLLIEKDGANATAVKQVLDWYVQTDWSDIHLPQAYCGASFREKFGKLESAMHRSDDCTPPVSYQQPVEPQIGKVVGTRTQEEALKMLKEADEC